MSDKWTLLAITSVVFAHVRGSGLGIAFIMASQLLGYTASSILDDSFKPAWVIKVTV